MSEDHQIITWKSNYENIANAIRNRLDTDDAFRPDEMADAIHSIPLGVNCNITQIKTPIIETQIPAWTRPQEWPDLDAINIDWREKHNW